MTRKAAALKRMRATNGLPGAGVAGVGAGGGGGGGAVGRGADGAGVRRTAAGAAAAWRSRSAFFRASLMRLMGSATNKAAEQFRKRGGRLPHGAGD